MKTANGYRKKRKSFNVEGHAHMLTFSCFDNRSFLQHDITRGYLIESVTNAKEKHNFDIWAYVIMPTHVHLLIWPKENEYSIAKILQSIKQSSAKKAINHLKRNKPDKLALLETGQKNRRYRFWQDGGGFDKNIDAVEVLKEMVDYIHHNPVRAGLVDDPCDWEWSSAREWVEPGSGPIQIDRESFPVLKKRK